MAFLQRRSVQLLMFAIIVVILGAATMKVAVMLNSDAAIRGNVAYFLTKIYPHTAPRLDNGSVTSRPLDYDAIVSRPRELPASFYGYGGYAMPRLYARPPDTLPAETKSASLVRRQGWPTQSEEVAVRCARRCVIRTNVIPSAFVSIYHQGEALAADRLWVQDGFVAVRGVPGENRIRVAVDPWRLLAINGAAFAWLAWAAVSLALLVRSRGWLGFDRRVTSESP
jgi:hypothetical protein